MFGTDVFQGFPGTSTNQFHGFLGELWTIWTRNVAHAVLLARWYWQKIPESVVQQAAMMQQQAQAAQNARAIDQQVNVQLGTLGIFPSNTGGTLYGGAIMDPNVAMFLQAMSMVRARHGEPPTGTASLGGDLAEAVLRGKRDAVDVMIGAAPAVQRDQLIVAVQLAKMSGFYEFLQIEAVVLAASALPRQRIPAFLPELQTETSELGKVAAGVQNLPTSCPRCGKSLRTPRAKQCRFCHADWH